MGTPSAPAERKSCFINPQKPVMLLRGFLRITILLPDDPEGATLPLLSEGDMLPLELDCAKDTAGMSRAASTIKINRCSFFIASISISLGKKLREVARGLKYRLPRLLFAAQHRFYHRFKYLPALCGVGVEPSTRHQRRLHKHRPRGACRGVHHHVATHRREALDRGECRNRLLAGEFFGYVESALRVAPCARYRHADQSAAGHLRTAALQLWKERHPHPQVGVARRKRFILARKPKVDREFACDKSVIALRQRAVP